jgi:poly(3-hydroxybutyrate) depolymerase
MILRNLNEKIAMDLCSALPEDRKLYHWQPDVGHYGIFNGRKFREDVVPIITRFIKTWNGP